MSSILAAFILAIMIVVVVLIDLMKTKDGDVSPSDLTRRTTIAGLMVIVCGVSLRLGAHWLAWPDKYSYSGARESTSWAVREAGYQDLGLALLALGVGLLLLATHHALAVSRQQASAS